MSDGASLQKILVAALRVVFPADVFAAVAPDGQAPPYCVFLRVTSTPEQTLADGLPLEHDRYQFDVYASNYDQAHQLAFGARQALLAIPYPVVASLTMEQDHYEADVKLHRVLQEYTVFSPRSI